MALAARRSAHASFRRACTRRSRHCRSGRARWQPWWSARSAFIGAIAGRTKSRCCGVFTRFTIIPEQVYFLISARAHPIDNVFTRLCGLVPIYILGLATPLTPAGGTVSAVLVLVADDVGISDPRQSPLAAGSARVGDFDPGLSSLAPHPGRAAGPQLRLDAADHGLDFRHPLPAARPSGRRPTAPKQSCRVRWPAS